MKKIYLLSTVALAGALTSCYDLDTQPFNGTLTADQREDIIAADPDKIDALSAGVYGNYNGWELGVGQMFDFGYPAIQLQLECRTADFFSINIGLYGWFSQCAYYTDNTQSNDYNLARWKIPYNTINSCNQVLGTIAADTEDNTLKFYRGQALGNRAFAYWNLAQLFQFNYVGHQNDPCVPIITDENQNEVAADGAPRATVQEVYDQILSDLNEGIALMTNNPAAVRADNRYINLDVLYGLRARTYLCMQQYSQAASDAKYVIDHSGRTPLSSTEAIGPGFITLSDHNWVWGIFMSSDDVHGLYTKSGFVGSYTYGYAYVGMWKAIDSKLFNRISENDPRRLWWIDPDTRESNAQYFTQADGNAVAYLESVGAPDYAVTKFAPYNNVLQQSSNQAEYPLMRIEEMYLILAEAQGLGGNLSEGKSTLENFVNSYRWLGSVPYTCSAGNAEEFLDEVWFQRRVELWGEGMAYFDIMRLNKPVDRRDSNWSDPQYAMDSYAYYIPAGSPVLLCQIPLTVIDNNPALTEADQNPYGTASL